MSKGILPRFAGCSRTSKIGCYENPYAVTGGNSYYTFDAFDKKNSFAPPHPDKEKIAAQEAALFAEEAARWADSEEQAI